MIAQENQEKPVQITARVRPKIETELRHMAIEQGYKNLSAFLAFLTDTYLIKQNRHPYQPNGGQAHV